MKQLFGILIIISCLYACSSTKTAQSSNSTKKGKLVTAEDSLFYAFGHGVISDMPAKGIQWNAREFEKGVKDKSKDKGKVTDEEALAVLSKFASEMQARQGREVSKEDPVKADLDSLSYSMGIYFIFQLEKIDFPVAQAAFVTGFSDAAKGENMLEDEELIKALVKQFNQLANEKAREAQQKENEAAATENKEIAEAFLAENKANPDVVTLESGIQYKVLESGDPAGKSPSLQDKVTIHYEGRLLDGTVFDSSFERGERASFPLSNLIKGWQIALPLMKPGDKWTLWIPSDLAYGNAGSPPRIPAGALLIFDIAYFGIAE